MIQTFEACMVQSILIFRALGCQQCARKCISIWLKKVEASNHSITKVELLTNLQTGPNYKIAVQ